MSSIENILLSYGLDNYIDICINEEIDIDVLKIIGELYLDIEIGMDNTDLDTLKLFGEPVPSNFNLGSLEEHLISFGVHQEDFERWIMMTRSISNNF